jgi:hypothetical protein
MLSRSAATEPDGLIIEREEHELKTCPVITVGQDSDPVHSVVTPLLTD